jgi:hypothetical protein
MRRIRETLRLHLQAGLSFSDIGRALKLSKSVAGKYVSLARAAGVDWALAQTLSDAELEARLYRPAMPRCSSQPAPDYARIHQELKRPGVTLQLLWEEYARDNALAYKYTSFCIKYRAWAQRLKRSMRQLHVAGEKMFVDYAGQTVPLIDAGTGEVTAAQIFVATLGASSYTYACATAGQTTADWIGAQVRRLRVLRRRGAPGGARPEPGADPAPRPLRPRAQPAVRGIRRPLRLRRARGASRSSPRQAQSRGGGITGRTLGARATAPPPLLQPGGAEPRHR